MTFLEEEEVFPTVEVVGAAVTEEVNDTSEVLETNQNTKRKLPDKPVEKKVHLFSHSFDLSLLFTMHLYTSLLHCPLRYQMVLLLVWSSDLLRK